MTKITSAKVFLAKVRELFSRVKVRWVKVASAKVQWANIRLSKIERNIHQLFIPESFDVSAFTFYKSSLLAMFDDLHEYSEDGDVGAARSHNCLAAAAH